MDTTHPLHNATLSIELEAKLRDVRRLFRDETPTNCYRYQMKILVAEISRETQAERSQQHHWLGGADNGYCAAFSAQTSSCAGLFGFSRFQESIHRNGPARKLAQALGQAKRRFLTTRKDVAEVRTRATGRFRQLLDGFVICGRPSQHRVRIIHG
ncbi:MULTISPECIES: hypothetical protein [unclassified Bradyrhizobium]|uniref:hypothetical protein n=1 Tax=unclassified Bradyrhizobium TaxID=2631580 RepID=UPI001FF7D54A|nr:MULTISPECIES: hypothetical protein [unclassified Bradyrhizobium]MCK1536834.1 hypothetical protein [Bradyrhizobium sp. 176]MCK1560137.1 hypothetical protein [Bradyrhizobium sp. 171]